MHKKYFNIIPLTTVAQEILTTYVSHIYMHFLTGLSLNHAV